MGKSLSINVELHLSSELNSILERAGSETPGLVWYLQGFQEESENLSAHHPDRLKKVVSAEKEPSSLSHCIQE